MTIFNLTNLPRHLTEPVAETVERVWFRFSPFHIKAETHWHPQMDMYIYQLEAEIRASMNMATYTFPG